MQSVNEDNNVMLETGQYFSDSLIWKLMVEFYCSNGIKAWNDVPSDITSNPYIANSYAHMIVAFIKDMIAIDPAAIQHPFYIMELGAGTGRFSFLTMKRIHELLELTGMEKVNIRYIMCDIADKNIQFFKTNPSLKTFIDRGTLDFARFDIESDQQIRLQLANIELTPQLFVNPLITLANYVFDTARHEAFNVSNQQIRRLLVDTSSPRDNIEDGKIKSLEKLLLSLRPSEQTGYDYKDDAMNEIMELYRTHLNSGSNFLIPNGAFKTITRLRTLANNRLFLISTDKGYANINHLQNMSPPRLVIHGTTCFSLSVNYHALKLYFEKNNGDGHIEPLIDTVLGTAAFTFGYKFSALPATRLALDQFIDGLSPYKFNSIYLHARDSYASCDFATIVSYIILGHHDPRFFYTVSARLMELVAKTDETALKYLEDQIPLLAANYYYLPLAADKSLFGIAYYCHFVGMMDAAIRYFNQAMLYNDDDYLSYCIHFNLGLCYKHKKMYAEAITHFKQALKLSPDCVDSKNMLNLLACTI